MLQSGEVTINQSILINRNVVWIDVEADRLTAFSGYLIALSSQAQGRIGLNMFSIAVQNILIYQILSKYCRGKPTWQTVQSTICIPVASSSSRWVNGEDAGVLIKVVKQQKAVVLHGASLGPGVRNLWFKNPAATSWDGEFIPLFTRQK